MNGANLLQQPSQVWRPDQPSRNIRNISDQRRIEGKSQTIIAGFQDVDRESCQLVESFAAGKCEPHPDMNQDNALICDETDWEIPDVRVIQMLGWDLVSLKGLSSKPVLRQPVSAPRLTETGWRTPGAEVTQQSALRHSKKVHSGMKLAEPQALFGTDWVSSRQISRTQATMSTDWTPASFSSFFELVLISNLVKQNQLRALTYLENSYVIENRDEVTLFIEENQLAGILLQAREPLNKSFGIHSVKTLTIVEDDEGYRKLFCLVMIPGNMQEARGALNSFDKEWWLRHSKKYVSKLNFDFELI